MTIIYIAGPMTGLPDDNKPAFRRVAFDLRNAGHTVLNPAESRAPPCGGTWAGWMRLALAQLVAADAVAMLPGWTKSKGAVWEYLTAMRLGIPAVPVDGAEGPTPDIDAAITAVFALTSGAKK